MFLPLCGDMSFCCVSRVACALAAGVVAWMILGLAWAVGCMKVELHWGGTCILGRRDRHRFPRLRARASLFCLTRARVAARRRMVDRSRWVARLVVSMERRYAGVLIIGSQLARVLPDGG